MRAREKEGGGKCGEEMVSYGVEFALSFAVRGRSEPATQQPDKARTRNTVAPAAAGTRWQHTNTTAGAYCIVCVQQRAGETAQCAFSAVKEAYLVKAGTACTKMTSTLTDRRPTSWTRDRKALGRVSKGEESEGDRVRMEREREGEGEGETLGRENPEAKAMAIARTNSINTATCPRALGGGAKWGGQTAARLHLVSYYVRIVMLN